MAAVEARKMPEQGPAHGKQAASMSGAVPLQGSSHQLAAHPSPVTEDPAHRDQQSEADQPAQSDANAETQQESPVSSAPPIASSGKARSSTGSKPETSKRPLYVVLLPALAAVAGAAWLWVRSRNSVGATPGKQPEHAGKAGLKAAAKAGSKASSPARKGGSARKGQAAGKKQAAVEAPAAASEEAPSPPEPILPDTLQVVVTPLQLLPPPNPPAPYAPLPLSGQNFVVAEDIDVEGSQTTYGVEEWAGHYPEVSPPTAPSVARAVSAGAACTAKAAVQRAGLDFVGVNYGNLLNKTRVSGGGATGVAIEVAAGRAGFGLASDWIGEARVPAACAYTYAYRPTPGPLGGPSVSTSAGGSVMSVLARDPALLQRVAQVLGAPGSSNIKGEILQFVVAQDLFDMCAPELQPAVLAVKKAILKWAGSDQAGAVQLLRFLSNHVTSWSVLSPGKELAAGFESPESTVKVHEFLEAALVATNILRAEDLHVRAGAVAKAAAVAAAPVEPLVGIDSPQGSPQAVPAALETEADSQGPVVAAVEEAGARGMGEGPPAVGEADADAAATPATDGTDTATAPSNGDTPAAGIVADAAAHVAATPTNTVLPPRPSARQLAAARELAEDVADCLKSTVKPDTLMVLPALPFPPPRRTADTLELLMFAKLTQSFNALATLGNCPTLTAPVGVLRDGSPVAISIMAVQKYDQRLLAVSQRLCPMIHESFEAVKEEITTMAMQRVRDEDTSAATAPSTPAATSNGHSTSPPSKATSSVPDSRQQGAADGSAGNGSTPGPAPPPPVDPKKLEKAEKAKAKGNELYQAGKYAEAMNEYTKAITFNPGSHVYLSNRAMACIKLFRFEQAEEDCNKVLKFELTDKDKVKALLRRATARDALQKYDLAEQDLRAVLKLEPNNKQAREDLRGLRQHQAQMAEAQAAMVQQMRVQQAAAGPGGGPLPPGAGLPLGMDPSMFPPGLLEGLAGQGMPGQEYGGYA